MVDLFVVQSVGEQAASVIHTDRCSCDCLAAMEGDHGDVASVDVRMHPVGEQAARRVHALDELGGLPLECFVAVGDADLEAAAFEREAAERGGLLIEPLLRRNFRRLESGTRQRQVGKVAYGRGAGDAPRGVDLAH